METLQSHKVKWQVSLSNGETFFEGKGDFVEYANELSPWQRLLVYIKEKGVFITSLSLYTDDGRTFNLPSLGKNPKFSAFDQPFKPFKFVMERAVARDHDVPGVEPDLFTTINAFYGVDTGEKKLIIRLSLWVDENNTNNAWSLINMEAVK